MADDIIQLPTDGSGKKTRTISETIGANTVHSQFVILRREPTFIAQAFDVVPAVAHLFTILNRATTQVVRIYRANVYISSQTTQASGALLKLSLERVTSTVALSGGTAVTPTEFDTADALPGSIDVMSKPTNTITTVREIKRFGLSGDEAVVATGDADAWSYEWFPRDDSAVLHYQIPFIKPFTLRTDGVTHEGLSFRGLVGTVGLLGFEFLFTVDVQ